MVGAPHVHGSIGALAAAPRDALGDALRDCGLGLQKQEHQRLSARHPLVTRAGRRGRLERRDRGVRAHVALHADTFRRAQRPQLLIKLWVVTTEEGHIVEWLEQLIKPCRAFVIDDPHHHEVLAANRDLRFAIGEHDAQLVTQSSFGSDECVGLVRRLTVMLSWRCFSAWSAVHMRHDDCCGTLLPLVLLVLLSQVACNAPRADHDAIARVALPVHGYV